MVTNFSVCVFVCVRGCVCPWQMDTPSDSQVHSLTPPPPQPPPPVSNPHPPPTHPSIPFSHPPPLHPQPLTHSASILWHFQNDHTATSPPPTPTISTATTTLLLLHPFSPSHIHICTHNLRSQTCPVLSPRLSQPLSRAQALLGKRGQASPNRMLMMSLTSGLQGRGEKWLWKAKITSLFHSLITYLALEMHAGASLRQACVQTIK